MTELLFPYPQQREHQDDLVKAVLHASEKRKHLLVHAPTGLGKTAAALGPALTVARKEELTVFFLTARHTQHLLALKTVHDIEAAHNIKIPVLDLIGKKWLCLQPNAAKLHSGEFHEYCRALREDKACNYFENLKRGAEISGRANAALALLRESDGSTNAILRAGEQQQVCPYEIALLHAREARVIIADYAYLFNEGIREPFLAKIGKELSRGIVVVDEAHNLIERVKDLASSRVSLFALRRAQQEAEKYGYDFHVALQQIERLLNGAGRDERFVQRDELIISDDEIKSLLNAGDHIREAQRNSFLGSVGAFLLAWGAEREGFARILTPELRDTVLAYRCLDAGVITGPVFSSCAASISMSGTLTPTQMYTEVLDLPMSTRELTLPSPFPAENRLVIVVPKTTTKFTARSPEQFAEIGKIAADVVNRVPGNSIIFLPSYDILERVKPVVQQLVTKTVFHEVPGLSKEDREQLLGGFKSLHTVGAVLLAVTTGSFGEGIDLPGNLLKCVVVVGLPLQKPTKEVEALIAYYNSKFGRGWDYGYVIPAFNKVLQSAGRAIRTMTDRGAIVFIDERFTLPQYRRLFPPEWAIKTTILYQKPLEQFFSEATAR